MKKTLLILFTLFLSVAFVSYGFAAGAHTFKAKLSGHEVVPPVKTAAKGEVVFHLSKDGKELKYTFTVKDIENVSAAHIHEGRKGKSGPPVVTLFSGPKKEGKFSGTLAEGTLTEKELFGSLKGKSLEALVKMIKAGDAYVNVHTDKHPDGEIRGEVK